MYARRTHFAFAPHLAISVALLLLGLLCLLASSPKAHAQSQPEALGSVSGAVRNAQGDPLPNITVFLEQYANDPGYPKLTATSDANGSFAFLSVFPGIYRLRFSDPEGHLADYYYVDARSADEATTVTVSGNAVKDIDMTLKAPGGSISVTIQAGVILTDTIIETTLYRQSQAGVWQRLRSESRIAPFGNTMTFSGLPFDRYRLCAVISPPFAPQYTHCYENKVPDSITHGISDATDIVVDSPEPVAITLDFTKNNQVQGQIIDPDGNPLAGIAVRMLAHDAIISIRDTVTDEQGRFFFNSLFGSYWLLANFQSQLDEEYPGAPYASVYYPNSFNTIDAQILTFDQTTHLSVTIKLVEAGSITGKVTLPDGTPLTNPLITLLQLDNFDTWTNSCYNYLGTICPVPTYDAATGIYTVTHIAPGTYRVGAEQFFPLSGQLLAGYHGGTHSYNAANVGVQSGKTRSNINIVVGESGFDGIITGTVSVDGVPQAGIIVGLCGCAGLPVDLPYLTATTDAQGKYQLSGLSVGYYRLAASDPQGRFATKFYEPEVGLTSFYVSGLRVTPNINLSLSPAGTIKGQVLTPAAEPSGAFRIVVYEYQLAPYFFLRLNHINVTSDSNGFFEIKGLAPNTYLVGAIPPETSIFPYGYERYAPGTSDLYTAQIIGVQAGEVTPNINIRFGELFRAALPFVGTGGEPVE